MQLLEGPDDEKLVTGMIEVAMSQVRSDRLDADTRALLQDLLTMNDAWYRVPNGGYAFLLESVPDDPIRPLRAACARFGHRRAEVELDAVRRAFPGGRIPATWPEREPFVAAADAADDSVFYSEAVVPVLAGWLRDHPSSVRVLDQTVDVPGEPGELVADADAATAARWLLAVSCGVGADDPAPDGTIRSVHMAAFRRDLDRLYVALANWRGAASIRSLFVSGTLPPYWRPIPFDAFPGLRQLDAQNSGMTDADVERLVRLPGLEKCNVFHAELLSPAARRLIRDRLDGGSGG